MSPSSTQTSGWVIDTSAYVRLGRAVDAEAWMSRIDRGLVRICFVTLLELGFAARTREHHERLLFEPPASLMPTEFLSPDVERRIVEVQRLLATRGEQRAASPADLIVAALAESARLTVLHVDKDFELIAAITGQPVERLVTAS